MKRDHEFWGLWFGAMLVSVVVLVGVAFVIGIFGGGAEWIAILLGLAGVVALGVYCWVTWDRLKSMEKKLDRLLEEQRKHNNGI